MACRWVRRVEDTRYPRGTCRPDACQGVGEGAVECIVEERKLNGPYSDIFELTKRVNLRQANKRCLESLA